MYYYILSAVYLNMCFQLKLCFSSNSIPTCFKLVLIEAETPWRCQKNHARAVSCSVVEHLKFKSKLFGANLSVFKAAEILLLILQVGPRVPIDLMWELMRRSIATPRPSTLIQPPVLQYLTLKHCLIRSKIFPHCLVNLSLIHI